ncbi:uncharacterized protein BT62DRAFT_1013980 [Guyanagaster necrorhizus]|uniref:Uncharacterized protein n=1 Tax=Guyanagaster necrorhizus TaxID=856835 RepID=A0A9P8AL99_9AGAR|nr:uncharacterized protein BT62DRAFT_1013980 [Guyanagaster necrorhizus MCA 3950]KAG7439416.1 hypothetical protein BT62DRAFT_1013980 [Guyanagaster necrorhizus MCA 3950]
MAAFCTLASLPELTLIPSKAHHAFSPTLGEVKTPALRPARRERRQNERPCGIDVYKHCHLLITPPSQLEAVAKPGWRRSREKVTEFDSKYKEDAQGAYLYPENLAFGILLRNH